MSPSRSPRRGPVRTGPRLRRDRRLVVGVSGRAELVGVQDPVLHGGADDPVPRPQYHGDRPQPQKGPSDQNEEHQARPARVAHLTDTHVREGSGQTAALASCPSHSDTIPLNATGGASSEGWTDTATVGWLPWAVGPRARCLPPRGTRQHMTRARPRPSRQPTLAGRILRALLAAVILAIPGVVGVYVLLVVGSRRGVAYYYGRAMCPPKCGQTSATASV